MGVPSYGSHRLSNGIGEDGLSILAHVEGDNDVKCYGIL